MPRVFITGGAGFLGKALIKEFHRFGYNDITVYSRDEAKQYEVRRQFPMITFILGDVRDRDRLTLAMRGHDTVIHCAAMKYIPQGETNPAEAIAVNVDGSRNVMFAAMETGVKHVVGISTDKACMPVNVYGATKLLMERMFLEADKLSNTRFHVVRYGNVIGSTGSVIPFFRRQAREGRPLTITDPDMTRYWLTIHQAVGLVMSSLDEPTGGTILVSRLPAQKLIDTAKAALLVEVGPTVLKDDIQVMGMRPGEKLNEDMISPYEAPYAEQAGDYIRIWPTTHAPVNNSDFALDSGHAELLTVDQMVNMILDNER